MFVSRDTKKAVAMMNLILLLAENKEEYIPVRKLANKLNMSQRTVYRYLDDLALMNIPIEFSGEGVKVELSKSVIQKLKELSKEVYDDLLITSIPSPVYKKVKNKFSEELKDELSKIEEIISNEDIISTDIDKLEKLFKASKNKQKVKVKYVSLSDLTEKERVIHPYQMFVKEGQLYCIGFCELRNDIRVFRIDRFIDIAILIDKFEIIKGFSLKHYLKNSLSAFVGNEEPKLIKAIVSDKLASYLRFSPKTPSQKIYSENGKNFVEFEIRSTTDFLRWVFSWTSEIQVVEPKEIVEKIKSTLQKLNSLYLNH